MNSELHLLEIIDDKTAVEEPKLINFFLIDFTL